jgi:hypothetical protein
MIELFHHDHLFLIHHDEVFALAVVLEEFLLLLDLLLDLLHLLADEPRGIPRQVRLPITVERRELQGEGVRELRGELGLGGGEANFHQLRIPDLRDPEHAQDRSREVLEIFVGGLELPAAGEIGMLPESELLHHALGQIPALKDAGLGWIELGVPPIILDHDVLDEVDLAAIELKDRRRRVHRRLHHGSNREPAQDRRQDREGHRLEDDVPVVPQMGLGLGWIVVEPFRLAAGHDFRDPVSVRHKNASMRIRPSTGFFFVSLWELEVHVKATSVP